MVLGHSTTPGGGDHTLDKAHKLYYIIQVPTIFMNNKPPSLEEYTQVGPEFFAKFNYVKTQLPAETSVEEALTIMGVLSELVSAKREEEEDDKPAIGFNK